MSTDGEIAQRLARLRARVAAAAGRAGRRPEDVTVLGVSKRVSAERVAEGVRAGLSDVAENYAQEAQHKLPAVRALLEGSRHKPPKWHFIGQLQRNKARVVAPAFDVVQSVDRARLGAELDRRAAAAARRLDVLLQVDLSAESGKGGSDPEQLALLLEASRTWRQLRVTGLMAIPAPADDPETLRPAFARLRSLRDTLRSRPGGEQLVELSMGMSADFEIAIEEGATIVRIGTALFGAR
ncbi:MAG: YggS family pyridoxal phosphate-dependent enzyme [Myxococcota bacterium]